MHAKRVIKDNKRSMSSNDMFASACVKNVFVPYS